MRCIKSGLGLFHEFSKLQNRTVQFGNNPNQVHHTFRHVDDMVCYGYEIIFPEETIYYSGDAVDIPEKILKKYFEGEIKEIYQDTCSYKSKNPSHGNIFDLEEKILPEKRKSVYCIHLDRDFRNKIIEKGFSVPEVFE